VAFTGHIAGFSGGSGTAETVQIQGPSGLDLKTLKAVTGLQAGIQGLLHHKTVMPNVRDDNQPVRQPAKLEAGTRFQARGNN